VGVFWNTVHIHYSLGQNALLHKLALVCCTVVAYAVSI